MKKIYLSNFITALVISIPTYVFVFGIEFISNKTSFFYFEDKITLWVGYESYLVEDFSFPIFSLNNIYPNENFSIVWMDAIPLYSLILKVVYKVFHIKFDNPFIFWNFICYFLSSYFIFKIIKLFTKNKYFQIVSTLIILNTPLLVNRLFWHSSLGAHFLILAQIYFLFCILNDMQKYIFHQSFLIGLSIFIHPYFTAMMLPLYLFCLYSVSNRVKIWKPVLVSLIILTTYFTFFVKFPIGTSFTSKFNGKYGSEFNSFFCGKFPNEFINKFLFCEYPYTSYGIEGYGYLGMGILFFLVFLIFNIKKLIKNYWKILLLLFLMVVYSFGNKYKIAHYQFFEFEPTNLHLIFLSIFRATGRFLWPFYYFICVISIFYILKLKNKIIVYLILSLGLILQINDVRYEYMYLQSQYSIPKTINSFGISDKFDKNLGLLYIIPDERCAFGETDHYVYVLDYVRSGGKIFGSRTARIKIDPSFCNNYTVEKSIDTYHPNHFILNSKDNISEKIKNNYTCLDLNNIFFELVPNYCFKN